MLSPANVGRVDNSLLRLVRYELSRSKSVEEHQGLIKTYWGSLAISCVIKIKVASDKTISSLGNETIFKVTLALAPNTDY